MDAELTHEGLLVRNRANARGSGAKYGTTTCSGGAETSDRGTSRSCLKPLVDDVDTHSGIGIDVPLNTAADVPGL